MTVLSFLVKVCFFFGIHILSKYGINTEDITTTEFEYVPALLLKNVLDEAWWKEVGKQCGLHAYDKQFFNEQFIFSFEEEDHLINQTQQSIRYD